MTLSAGCAIEYTIGQHHLLAVVRQVGKSLRVVNERGDVLRISKRAHSLTLDTGIDLALSDDALVALLADLRAEADNLAKGADLHAARAAIFEAGNPVEIQDIADQLFESASGVSLLATQMLLRLTDAFFLKRGRTYQARPEAQTRAMIKRESMLASSAEDRAMLVLTLRMLALSTKAGDASGIESSQRHLDEVLASPAGRAHFEVLESYALEGDKYGKARKANAMIDEILSQKGKEIIELEGKKSLRAFELLVMVGHFDPFENLALRRARIEPRMDPALEAVAAQLAADLPYLDATSLDGLDRQDRVDLSDLEVVTIDDPTTRDLDDALSARRLEDGRVEIGIHIADPAEIIPIGHPLDLEAQRRGTSVYVPEGTVSMFPRSLSETAMSLLVGKVRPAISFFVVFTPELEPEARRVELSWVKPQHRYAYDEVDAILAEDSDSETLRLLSEVAGALQARRIAQGAVVMQIPESRVRAARGEDGAWDVVVWVLEDTLSRDLVQEMMILAGETAGMVCRDAGLPIVYRSQPQPSSPGDKMLLSGKVHPLSRAFGLRKLMRRGNLLTRPSHHFGLGLDVYAQATSPIRRYSDLLLHRQLRAHLRDEPLAYDRAQIEALRSGLESTSIAASIVERRSKRFWSLVHFEGLVGQRVAAQVVDFLDDRRKRALIWVDHAGYVTVANVRKGTKVGDRVSLHIEASHPRRELLFASVVE